MTYGIVVLRYMVIQLRCIVGFYMSDWQICCSPAVRCGEMSFAADALWFYCDVRLCCNISVMYLRIIFYAYFLFLFKILYDEVVQSGGDNSSSPFDSWIILTTNLASWMTMNSGQRLHPPPKTWNPELTMFHIHDVYVQPVQPRVTNLSRWPISIRWSRRLSHSRLEWLRRQDPAHSRRLSHTRRHLSGSSALLLVCVEIQRRQNLVYFYTVNSSVCFDYIVGHFGYDILQIWWLNQQCQN